MPARSIEGRFKDCSQRVATGGTRRARQSRCRRGADLLVRDSRRCAPGCALATQTLDGSAVARGIWLGNERGFEERSRKPTRPSSVEARDPFGDGLRCGVEAACGCGLAQAVVHNGADHVLSTFGREARIVVGVHSVPRRIVEVWQHQRSRSGPNGQPPESSQLAMQLIRFTRPSRCV